MAMLLVTIVGTRSTELRSSDSKLEIDLATNANISVVEVVLA
jgi:hypothetical protein